jgi:glycerol-3-phosphate acyltransferase PlsY
MPVAATAVAVVIAYLIGSISFAIVVSYFFGIADPRSYGSKNPGATNVLRSGKKLAAALTLLGDALKGYVVVAVAIAFGAEFQFNGVSIGLIGLAVFLGHLYPIYFRFHGGKGVATALGVLLGFNLWIGLATLATWVIIFFFFRISSLAALIAAIFVPVYCVFLFGVNAQTVAVMIMSLFLIWRHRGNIRNLREGKEGAIAKAPAAEGEGDQA